MEALAVGCSQILQYKLDLSDIVGTLSDEEANLIEAEIKKQHQTDQSLWL